MNNLCCLVLLFFLLVAGCAQGTAPVYTSPDRDIFGTMTEEPDPAMGTGDVTDMW